MVGVVQYGCSGGREAMKKETLKECGRLAICELPAIVVVILGAEHWFLPMAFVGAMIWSSK